MGNLSIFRPTSRWPTIRSELKKSSDVGSLRSSTGLKGAFVKLSRGIQTIDRTNEVHGGREACSADLPLLTAHPMKVPAPLHTWRPATTVHRLAACCELFAPHPGFADLAQIPSLGSSRGHEGDRNGIEAGRRIREKQDLPARRSKAADIELAPARTPRLSFGSRSLLRGSHCTLVLEESFKHVFGGQWSKWTILHKIWPFRPSPTNRSRLGLCFVES